MRRARCPSPIMCGMALVLMLAGCSTPKATNRALGVGAIVLGHTPTTNIVQTYYLGVFDPREQLPPTIYRIRVQGQASGLAWTKFASGWVHADLVDSLSGSISVDKNGMRLGQVAGDADTLAKELDKSGLNRRLVMFGPEGFREAPKNHRLVVVMGNNPEGFFGAVDRALGTVASVTQPVGAGPEVVREMFSDLSRMRQEKRAVQTLLDVAGQE